jgi:hypothetical protein
MGSTTYTEPNYADWLRAIDAQLEAWASGASITSYSIAGRTFTKAQSQNLIAFREYVYGLYQRKTYGNVTLANMNSIRMGGE